MITRILTCLDGSESGRRATDLAVDLARRSGASVDGVVVVDEPGIRSGSVAGIGSYYYKAARDEALLADAHRRSREWRAAFELTAEPGVGRAVMELHGDPAQVLLAQMQAHDLLVIGQRANFHFETAVEDHDTWRRLLRHCGKPVLIVPAGTRPTVHSVLVVFDGSPAASRALGSFLAMPWPSEATVHLVGLAGPGRTGWEIAETALERLRGSACEPATIRSISRRRGVAEYVLGLERSLGVDLVVTSDLDRWSLGGARWHSDGQDLVDGSTAPLFLHH